MYSSWSLCEFHVIKSYYRCHFCFPCFCHIISTSQMLYELSYLHVFTVEVCCCFHMELWWSLQLSFSTSAQHRLSCVVWLVSISEQRLVSNETTPWGFVWMKKISTSCDINKIKNVIIKQSCNLNIMKYCSIVL